jgi:hypothetical protein
MMSRRLNNQNAINQQQLILINTIDTTHDKEHQQ